MITEEKLKIELVKNFQNLLEEFFNYLYTPNPNYNDIEMNKKLHSLRVQWHKIPEFHKKFKKRNNQEFHKRFFMILDQPIKHS